MPAPQSSKQTEIYEFILQYTRDHGYPPSVREIGAAEGYRAARATLGDNTERVLAEHIQALRGFRAKKTYDQALEQAPADALNAYLAAARKKKSENGTEQKGTGK